MDNIIVAEIISAIGGITVTAMSVILAPKLRNRQYRTKYLKGMSILGRWYGEWEFQNKVYRDTIEITRWLKNNQFEGLGEWEKGRYTIWGELNVDRLLVAIYKGENYPEQPNIGVFMLRLSADANSLEGYWYGTSMLSLETQGGRYTWKRGEW